VQYFLHAFGLQLVGRSRLCRRIGLVLYPVGLEGVRFGILMCPLIILVLALQIQTVNCCLLLSNKINRGATFGFSSQSCVLVIN